MSHYPEKGGADKQTELSLWPVHLYEAEDGQVLELTYANTIIRRFGDGNRHMDHVYCFENKIGSAALEAVRIFGQQELVHRMIDEGYSDHNLLNPTDVDREQYKIFLVQHTEKSD